MTNDDLEFSISQYVDGDVPEPQRTALESRLKQDASAAAILAEYQKLNQLLVAAPLPEVRWNRFARSISSAIDAAEEARADAYRIPSWIRAVAPLALAASILIMAGVGVHLIMKSSGPVPQKQLAVIVSHPNIVTDGSEIVIGPPPDSIPTGPSEVEVFIGPGSAVKDDATVVQFSDEVVSRPSHVSIASGVVPEHDTAALPPDME